jgi:hypothetical protein
MVLGDRWTQVRRYAEVLQYALLAALAVARFLWRRLARRG